LKGSNWENKDAGDLDFGDDNEGDDDDDDDDVDDDDDDEEDVRSWARRDGYNDDPTFWRRSLPNDRNGRKDRDVEWIETQPNPRYRFPFDNQPLAKELFGPVFLKECWTGRELRRDDSGNEPFWK